MKWQVTLQVRGRVHSCSNVKYEGRYEYSLAHIGRLVFFHENNAIVLGSPPAHAPAILHESILTG